MFKGLRFEMVCFQLRVFDHVYIQILLSPTQDLSNDVSNVGLSEIFIFSTFRGLRFEMVYFQLRVSDLGDNRNLPSRNQDPSNDLSNLVIN